MSMPKQPQIDLSVLYPRDQVQLCEQFEHTQDRSAGRMLYAIHRMMGDVRRHRYSCIVCGKPVRSVKGLAYAIAEVDSAGISGPICNPCIKRWSRDEVFQAASRSLSWHLVGLAAKERGCVVLPSPGTA
jgi:hypothetical protein